MRCLRFYTGMHVLQQRSFWDRKFCRRQRHWIGLSIIYALVLSRLIYRLDLKISLIIGVLYGLVLFILNVYGFAIIFPWFVETRDWITLTAHGVFGISAAAVHKMLSR